MDSHPVCFLCLVPSLHVIGLESVLGLHVEASLLLVAGDALACGGHAVFVLSPVMDTWVVYALGSCESSCCESGCGDHACVSLVWTGVFSSHGRRARSGTAGLGGEANWPLEDPRAASHSGRAVLLPVAS